MKFSINKRNISNEFQIITDIAQKNTTNDIISNLLIITDKNNSKVFFKVTNFELTFEFKIDAEVEENGKICVNAFHFTSVVRESQEETIHFELKDNNWILIKIKNSKLKLPGLDINLFPDVFFDDLPNSFFIPWKEWQREVAQVFFAIGDNPSRKNLTGMNLKVFTQDIKLLASDAYRMAISDIKLENQVEGSEGDLIIPKKNLQDFRKLSNEDEKNIKISFSDRFFQMETEKFKMKSSLIEAAFPDLTKLLFEEAKYKIKFYVADLIKLLKLLKIFMSDINPSTKITFEGNKMTIESEKNDVGESVHNLECIYDGERISVGFNIRFLSETLTVFEKEKEVELKFNNPGAPVIISSQGMENYKSVVMPMRIEW